MLAPSDPSDFGVSALRRFGVLAVGLAFSILAGCAGDSGGNGNRGSGLTTGPRRTVQSGNVQRPAPRMRPVADSKSLEVRAALLPLGGVPYDNASLPLVSPDGSRLVTQIGLGPSMASILAAPEAGVPLQTRLEVYNLVYRPEGSGTGPVVRGAVELGYTVNEPVLLGRACDEEGFLVEAPRENGARWIGKVNWETGSLTWLVEDDAVNAFASLGPRDQLAWSRRAIDGERFELVVRHRDETTWTMPAEHDDWIMPTWSGLGDGLFVMTLRGGHLDYVHGAAADLPSFRASMRRLSLATGSGIKLAYESAQSQPAVNGLGLPPREEIVFLHPAIAYRGHAAVWRPHSRQLPDFEVLGDSVTYTVTAVPYGPDHYLVTGFDDLLMQSVASPAYRAELLAGLLVPRPTSSQAWPFVVLEPAEGAVGLIALRPLRKGE